MYSDNTGSVTTLVEAGVPFVYKYNYFRSFIIIPNDLLDEKYVENQKISS